MIWARVGEKMVEGVSSEWRARWKIAMLDGVGALA